jgi:hypothetical protein
VLEGKCHVTGLPGGWLCEEHPKNEQTRKQLCLYSEILCFFQMANLASEIRSLGTIKEQSNLSSRKEYKSIFILKNSTI